MFAVAILASITLAAPDPDGNVHANAQLPLEAYVVTGRTTLTLLPTSLRDALGAALTSPKYYEIPAKVSATSPAQSAETLTNDLATAFATRATDPINTAAANCIRFAVRTAIPDINDTVSNLITTHHRRLAFEVRVDPARLIAAPDLAALSARITALSPDLAAQLFPEDLDHDLALIETRLEQASLLSARMLTDAWSAAGEPKLTSATPLRTPTTQDAVAYVASRNSKVFHKADCPHAARIKKANLVRFDSFIKASKTGRKPCKTCKPTK